MTKFLPVPNSPYIILADDLNFNPKAVNAGTIILETQIAQLPEVLALRRGDVVLDIGAYIGDTALIFLDRGCIVHAFEPYPDAFHCLTHNAPGAICYNAAVGNGEPAEFNPSAIDGNLATRSLRQSAGDGKTLRIDDLALARVQFIKIDVEGYEPLVLDGASETISRCRPIILVEAYDLMLAGNQFNRHDIIKRLLALDYSVKVAIGAESDVRVDYICRPSNRDKWIMNSAVAD